MTATTGPDRLIPRLDSAVRGGEPAVVVQRVKRELEELLAAGPLELPAALRRSCPDNYARRLLHRDDALGYTALVMVWGPGQGTALHDHAGIWCVEVVVEGEVDVDRYELLGEEGDGLCRFVRRGTLRSGFGAAGALIPPLEHHVLRNPHADRSAITLHVYGGEMDHCSVFLPQGEGLYRREQRRLVYSA